MESLIGMEVYLIRISEVAEPKTDLLLKVDGQERSPARRGLGVTHTLLANEDHLVRETDCEDGLQVGGGSPVQVLDSFPWPDRYQLRAAS